MFRLIFKKESSKELKFWRKLHFIADRAEPRVRKAFFQALDKIRSNSKLNEIAVLVELGDADRIITALGLDSLAEELKPLTQSLRRVLEDSAKIAPDSLPVAIRSKIAFDLINPRTVEFIRGYELNLIQNISDKTRESIRHVVATAAERGGSTVVQAKYIRDSIGLLPRQAQALRNYEQMLMSEGRTPKQVSKMVERMRARKLTYRAKMISRTETIRSANRGQLALWNQAAEQGLLDASSVRVNWVVTDDDRLCEICNSLKDASVELNGQFTTTIERVKANPQTFSEQTPPIHPQCLPVDTNVLAFGVSATSERKYSGDLVIIRTAGQKKLAVTPNHPILIQSGFCAAQDIKVGDNVLSRRVVNKTKVFIRNNNENMPALIQDITETFRSTFGVTTTEMPISAPDFHDDVVDDDIAVIRTNGFLRDTTIAGLLQSVHQNNFISTLVGKSFLDRQRSFTFRLKRFTNSSTGFMCMYYLIMSLFSRHSTPLNFFRFALGMEANISSFEEAGKSLSSDSNLFTKIIDRSAGQVFADEIVSVDRVKYSGQVYNLQTENGVYFANDIITHNCRCALAIGKF